MQHANNALYKKRRATNAIGLTLSMTAMAAGSALVQITPPVITSRQTTRAAGA